ncbi:hypothetical protein LTR66_003084 [Elasticomyces elasticus]|nr:hypothetical protein LTR66_003084 [Elasticomyces elasticus]
MPVMNPITPLEAGAEVFQKGRIQPFLAVPHNLARPLSQATEFVDTDFDDDDESLFEEDSPKGSFGSFDGRSRSQTTLSSYDELPTPQSHHQDSFEIRFRPVEGPTGPHLFRTSQASAEFTFDNALQMSPLLSKQTPSRTDTAFSEETITQSAPPRNIDSALVHDFSDEVRGWSSFRTCEWLCESGFDASVVEMLEVNDITGAILLDLQFEDLKELGIQSFGKRHQLWNTIEQLRGGSGRPSPVPTPFQDISRPCSNQTDSNGRARDRSRGCCADTPVSEHTTPLTPAPGRKRRGRKHKHNDVITPAESVSIVAIEQLLPKPHKCAKGERCAKWRKQQKQLARLHEEHGFPISPTRGGHIFIAGNPGNAASADNIVPNVHRQDSYRPASEAVPSVVASSDLLGPGQLPGFALHEDMLQCIEKRDPQESVKQFLSFQHMQSPVEDFPPSPPMEMFPAEHVEFFPTPHQQTLPPLHPPFSTPGPHGNLKNLPRLAIPRSASANPYSGQRTVRPTDTAFSPCRSVTASPGAMYRHGTPASEMDIPLTAIGLGPISRDESQSVPPNMHLREPVQLTRPTLRAAEWRRPSFALPALNEGEVFSPAAGQPAPLPLANATAIPENSGHSQYGDSVTHTGWMKKRKTKMLRHEWHDAHFRLAGTKLAMHPSARLSSAALNTIDVDEYAVACSSLASQSKLGAALKSLKITAGGERKGKDADPAAFAFQLVPAGTGDKIRAMHGKTHHFAVKNRDERIDWMRELMLAKALRQRDVGYSVEVHRGKS